MTDLTSIRCTSCGRLGHVSGDKCDFLSRSCRMLAGQRNKLQEENEELKKEIKKLQKGCIRLQEACEILYKTYLDLKSTLDKKERQE